MNLKTDFMKKFPRYSRKQNKRCKLTDEQIDEIKEMRKSGLSYSEIARDYGITAQAVYYWCLEENGRKRIAKEQCVRRKISGYIRPNEFNYKEYRQRKIKLIPEYKDYENQFTNQVKKESRPNFTETRKRSDKTYRLNHINEIKKRLKEYQLKNLDKFREYNKKYRESKRKNEDDEKDDWG